ncbi:MAG TPA: hypothetical protein HA326_02545 [Thermoplasmata archaeon]|nr:hypothetical protein [Thermoplasmata archaeon]
MSLDPVFEAAMLASLGASLVIFLALTARGPAKRAAGVVDFGTAFSLFLAGWMATELLEALAPAAWSEAVGVLHLAVLATLAAWMNLRWRWSLRRAQEGS